MQSNSYAAQHHDTTPKIPWFIYSWTRIINFILANWAVWCVHHKCYISSSVPRSSVLGGPFGRGLFFLYWLQWRMRLGTGFDICSWKVSSALHGHNSYFIWERDRWPCGIYQPMKVGRWIMGELLRPPFRSMFDCFFGYPVSDCLFLVGIFIAVI